MVFFSRKTPKLPLFLFLCKPKGYIGSNTITIPRSVLFCGVLKLFLNLYTLCSHKSAFFSHQTGYFKLFSSYIPHGVPYYHAQYSAPPGASNCLRSTPQLHAHMRCARHFSHYASPKEFSYSLRIRASASIVLSFVPKAVRRKNPSPLAPKPEPGVPTTCTSCRSLSKNSQEVRPSGVFNQI